MDVIGSTNNGDQEVQLPEKLSDCLELALADLAKVEADERYRVNMSDWHDPTYSSPSPTGAFNFVCSVCLAGAVMAKTLKAPIDEEYFPTFYSDHNHRMLTNLDIIRTGILPTYLANGLKVEKIANPPLYGAPGWREAMADIVAQLRERGL